MQRLPVRTRSLFLTIAVGLAGGLVAVAFHVAIHQIYLHGIERVVEASRTQFLVGSFLIIGGTSALSGWLLSHYCPEAAGSGIPQVKAAFWKDMGFIPLRVVGIKFLAGALTVGGGASLGREGPSIQLAGGVASNLAGSLGVPRHKRRMACAAGAAAGLAAAFNTPIAAVTFVLEEIIGDLNSRMLGSILLAAVIGALVAHGLLGEQPAFTLRGAGSPGWPVYLATPVVAAAAALAGVVFQRFALGVRAWNKRPHAVPAWLRTTAGGLAVWAIGAAVVLGTGHTGVFSLGYEDLSAALNHQMDWRIAALLLLTKLAATALCFGLGGCGGIFAPTLFFGGMAGASLAGLLNLLVPISTAGHVTLAVVGMCACLGAVVRAPVTGLLIVFEMTHEFAMVPALMIAGLVGVAVARGFHRHNFYDVILEQDGQNIERIIPPRDLRSWLESPISRAANFRPALARDLSSAGLRALLQEHRHERFPVVEGGRAVGVLSRANAQKTIDHGTPPILEPAITCRRETTIREVQQRIIESPSNLMVLVGGADERVIGLVTLHDLLRAEMLFTKED